MADDNIQHGIDDNPNDDPKKGAVLGGVGGVAVGAAAGAALGPLGALAGAAIGGIAGAIGSGAAVGAVDQMDNDDTITGLGEGATPEAGSAGHDIPGVHTGGYAAGGTPDTRGLSEKASDAITGDVIDDKTHKVVVP